MLLNTWLSFARRQLFAAGGRRVNRSRFTPSDRMEQMEERMLLSGNPVLINSLVINADNQSLYTNAAGGLSITNANMVGKDGLVIEGISISPTSGDAISVNLSNISLQRLAIESVVVAQYSTVGFNLDLTNVTGLNSVAIEDVQMNGTGRGLDLNFVNTDAGSLTVDDSTIPGILVTAAAGSDIRNGLITENRIAAPAGFEGVMLDVQSTPTAISTANGFRILNNTQLTTRDRDAVRVNSVAPLDITNSTITQLDSLTITGNTIGSAEGADVLFRAEGDTFVQPFRLTNRATKGELLQTFVFDLRDLGLQFDPDPTTGKPFTPVAGTGALTGVNSAVLSNNNQTLTVTFTDFNASETLQFVLDIDLLGGAPASIFGNQLIGADVQFAFSGNKNVAGQMAGDPLAVSASQFLPGAGQAGVTHGISINATGTPVTNLSLLSNVVTGAPGYGLYLNSKGYSDMTGVISGNQFSSSGRDGVRVSMVDSRFTGGMFDNTIANNGGNGISLLPSSSMSGRVQSVTGGRLNTPFVITSANHGLQTGDEVIIQGIQEGTQGVNHTANGKFLITRLTNNTFSLQGTGVDFGRNYVYSGGGAWYVPDFRNGGTDQNSARNFAQIDLQVESAPQAVTGATNTADIQITSAAHGLQTGDMVRITGVQGNSAANGTFAVTVVSANEFLLKGVNGNGDFTIGGSFVRVSDVAPNGDIVPQGIQGNSITGNSGSGIYAAPEVGSTVRADIVRNTISLNNDRGVAFQSYSFGLGTALPLDQNDPNAVVQSQDLGFSVHVGTESPGQGNVSGGGNTLHQNRGAGIALEALDFGTGSFDVWNNTISSTRDDANAASPYAGDGIFVRLDDGRLVADAAALLQRSVIKNNVIGVDNLGSAGNGLFFSMRERTRIQDLEVVNNTFLNSGLDGFHFERSEDARLNSVLFEKNKSTNNVGDGFDLFAKNTTLDRQDFFINDNFIEDNGQYGLRVDAQADARLGIEFNSNSVKRNGRTPAGNGFHPNDGVPGSAQSAGGVGIRAFQQIDISFTSVDTTISDNVGDGFSIDAFNYFDTLEFRSTFQRVTMDNNTLTGFRNHGAAFGGFSFVDSSFSGNGEDGVRVVSIDDKTDVYRRRVGGMDLDLIAMNSVFSNNGKDGVHVGQGVSAVFGDGTAAKANTFESNGRDGLKITQHNSPYLDNLLSFGNDRRRNVQVNYAFFVGNGNNGIDIGMDVSQEGGNSQHGDEVASDISVTVNQALIASNGGDGVEYLGDDTFEIGRFPGGGQDVPARYNSALEVSNSRITDNAGRGVDVLNRQQQDTFVTLRNNDILSNGLEGVYVVNTASINQRQRNSADLLEVYFDTGDSNLPNPNIELRVQDNLIQSNGNRTSLSRVPTRFEFGNNDASGVPNLDWGPANTLIQGTLGGLVVRVGTAESAGKVLAANPGRELGRAGIDAEIWKNAFDGNFGADVYFDNFVSHIPNQTRSNFDLGDDPDFLWNQGQRDPLSRFDLSFRQNTGNSLDVINGFSFLDNIESEFKSRNVGSSQSPPDHAHVPLDPGGHWGDSGRRRNATRTIGFVTDQVGDDPSFWPAIASDGTRIVNWSYDGLGTPTWRLESDFDISGFKQTDPTVGFSSFFNNVTMDGLWDYQWDTGVDTPSFTGATPYSLQRGDIFNVLPGEDPIGPDSFENNNSYVGATNLGVVSGVGYSVNSKATNQNLNIHLKADRDYYKFTAGGSGALTVNVGATDTLGADLRYMIYEIDPNAVSEEVPMQRFVDGNTDYQQVGAGATSALTVNVVEGRQYIVEILSNELENVGTTLDGKPFRYGTVRSYDLSMDAPVLGTSGGGGGTGGGGGGSNPGSGGGGGGTTGGGSLNTGGSKPGNPDIESIGPVTPDPRSVSAGVVTVTFTENVTGVDINDFTLTRDSQVISLAGLTVTPLSAWQYTIDLGKLTAEAGQYTLSIVSAGSGIKDTENNRLLLKDIANPTVEVATKSDIWTLNNSVTSLNDLPDTNPGDGVAAAITGEVTLRASVMESNASAGDDIVVLGAGVYQLSIGGTFEDKAARGDLDVTGNLIIRGVSAGATIIDAGLLDRVFHVHPGVTLTLENLTIQNGFAFDGAGIFNLGTVNLVNVNVIRNVAGNQGGGVFNAGTLNARNSSISENISGSRGGAVNNTGAVSFLNTTLSSNYAVSRGGGLFNETAATAILQSVTIAVNQSGSRGGGFNSESATATTISNSLVEANETDAVIPGSTASSSLDFAGGVRSLGANRIQVLDSTYTSAASGGLLTNDVFGRDAAPISLATGDLSYVEGNGVGINPLLPGSAAMDAGDNSLYPTLPLVSQLDAVGNPRLIDGNRDGVFVVDQGAAEFLTNTPVAIFTATPNPAAVGELISFDASKSTHPNPSSGRFINKLEWYFDWPSATPDLVTTGAVRTATHSYIDSSRTSYTVRLVVTDNQGASSFVEQQVTVGRPTQPVVLRPFTVTTDTTPEFRWQASPAKYTVVLKQAGKPNVTLAANITATTFTPKTPLALGDYSLVVTASNAMGSNTSAEYFFRVTALTLSSPSGKTFDVTPKFNWDDIPGTSRYDIWVARNKPTYAATVIRDSFVDTNSFEAQTSLGLGEFQWWVRAFDGDGTPGEWSAPRTFTIETPVFTLPLSITMDTTPTFAWTDMGAARYELWVNQVGGPVKIIYQSALTTNTYTPITPIPNGTYQAWVRALASDGEAGLWSPLLTFQMDYRVGPVTYAPIGVTTDLTPTFRWQAVDGALRYDLWVDNVTTGVKQVIRVQVDHVNGAKEITYTPSKDMVTSTYRWWVQAIGANGAKTAWSTARDFLVPVPSIINPRGAIGTNLPLFTWSGVAQYVKYDLWVDNLTTGAKQVLRVQDIVGYSYKTTLPLENGTFRAWLRGTDKDGNISQWSNPADFTINTGVGNAPSLISPNSFAGTRPTFRWQGGTNVVTYELLVKDLTQPSQPVVINVRNIIGNTFTSNVTLISGKTYRWWVRGLDIDGNGLPWSQPLDFRVVSADQTEEAPAFDPSLAGSVIPVVLNVQGEGRFDDEYRSISAHPAGIVVQIAPEQWPLVEEVTEPVMAAPIAGAEIDDVMAAWSSDQLIEVAVPTLSAAVPVVTSSGSTETGRKSLSLPGAAFAMIAGLVVNRRRRKQNGVQDD